MACGQLSELYTNRHPLSKVEKPHGGWMFGNISERPHVLPFTVSHERDTDVLGRSVQRDAQNARTLSSSLIAEGHVFGNGVGCRTY